MLREAARRLAPRRGRDPGGVGAGYRAEVALAIDRRVRQAGFERPAFDTIVASGPNAALPHARPGERTITEGDLVVLDFGSMSLILRRPDPDRWSVRQAPGARGLRRRPRGARPGHRRGRARAIALRDRRRGPGHARPLRSRRRCSGMARDTAWASKCTRIRGFRGGGRTWTPRRSSASG